MDSVRLAAVLIGICGCAHPTDGRPYVNSLKLRGVHNVSAWTLEHGLASRPGRVPFDQLELERDRMRVQRFYEAQGYYATRVVLAEASPRPNSAAVDVVIAVEEGPPTLIGDVKVFGTDGLDDQTRKKMQQYQLGLRRGQVFHHADYEKFKDSLARELAKSGVRDTDVEGVVEVLPASNVANITVTFHPTVKEGAR